MTNQEINWAIAKHLGWKVYQIDFAFRSWINLYPPGSPESNLNTEAHRELSWEEFRLLQEQGDMALPIHETCPSYSTDLNAMHEAVAHLNELELSRYADEVCDLAYNGHHDADIQKILKMEARELAECYVIAIGKWEGK